MRPGTFGIGWRILGAPRVGICLAAVIGGVYVLERIGGDGAFVRWRDVLGTTAPGMVLLALVAVNLVVRSIDRALSSRALPPGVPESVDSMDVSTRVPALAPDQVVAWLREHGFRPREIVGVGGGIGVGFVGVTGRNSFLPGVLLRVGVIVFGLGLLLSLRGRAVESIDLVEGGRGVLFGQTLVLDHIENVLPERFLQVGASSLRLVNLGGTVRFGEDTRVVRHTPAVQWHGSRLRITELGFAPETELTFDGGNDVIRPLLRLLPPGREDLFRSGPEGRFRVRLEPESVIRKGRVEGRWYSFTSPSYRFFAIDGDAGSVVGTGSDGVVHRGAVGGGEVGEVRVKVGPPGFWMRLEAVRDPGLPAVRAGLVLLGLGVLALCIRPFWYKREVVFLPVDGGETMFGYREEYMKKWAVSRFHGWRREFLPTVPAHSLVEGLEPDETPEGAPGDSNA